MDEIHMASQFKRESLQEDRNSIALKMYDLQKSALLEQQQASFN
jgi:hypothetical protein